MFAVRQASMSIPVLPYFSTHEPSKINIHMYTVGLTPSFDRITDCLPNAYLVVFSAAFYVRHVYTRFGHGGICNSMRGRVCQL